MSAQPGLHAQPVARPQEHDGEWQSSLFDCFSNPNSKHSPNLCLKATCCPCFTYGRTQARLNDPTRTDYGGCGGDCCFFCAASCFGLACFFPCFARGNIRQKFSLKGGVCGDCMRSCCCMCCSLIQNEKEVVYQSLQNPRQGYKAPNGMYAGQ